MNEQEIQELLKRIEALEKSNSSLEDKFKSLKSEVDTINKFIASITESQSIETTMNEIESVTKLLTNCDNATFYCYDKSNGKFFSHGDYRNWQGTQSADALKDVFNSKKIRLEESKAIIPLVTAKDKPLGVIVAEKDDGFKKGELDSFKKGSQLANTAELALQKEYEHQGRITDELTGLKNRQGLNEYLENTLCGSLNENKPVSIIMCDIDHFKDVNDTYGHEAGDIVLKEVAEALNNGTRDGADCAFRMGGEEMVCILNCEPEQAIEIAERLREKIAGTAHTVDIDGIPEEISVTVSMGVCGIKQPENIEITPENIREIFDSELVNADKAAYRAKNNGRNQVEVFDDKVNKSYLAYKAAEILCADCPEQISATKNNILTCLESGDNGAVESVTKALQRNAMNNPYAANDTQTLISKINKSCVKQFDFQEIPQPPEDFLFDNFGEPPMETAYPAEPPAYQNNQPAYRNAQPEYRNEQPAYRNEQRSYRNEPKKAAKFFNKDEYKNIQNKTFIGTDAKTAYEISRFAENAGIQFSAKFNGSDSAVTVDGVKDRGFINRVKSMSQWSDKVQIKAAKSREQTQTQNPQNRGR